LWLLFNYGICDSVVGAVSDLCEDAGVPPSTCQVLTNLAEGPIAEGQDLNVFVGGTTAENAVATSLFSVTDLPRINANLLLVVEPRDDGGALINFQSYAFPVSEQDAAQVAIIDATGQDFIDLQAHLVVNDKIVRDAADRPVADQQVRAEELDFGKVWKVEAGDYEAFISTEPVGAAEEPLVAEVTEEELEDVVSGPVSDVTFAAGQNYVILRTGKDEFFVYSGAFSLLTGAVSAVVLSLCMSFF